MAGSSPTPLWRAGRAHRGERIVARCADPGRARMESYPLSNAQARIWVLAQMEGGSAAYQHALVLDLEGSLDEAHSRTAFETLIARHEALRTAFVTDGAIPRQKIHPAKMSISS